MKIKHILHMRILCSGLLLIISTSALFAVALFRPRDHDLLDPQINVMNVGQVLDSRPIVSSDRKYITLSGTTAGSASLQRLDIANIITFDLLGMRTFSSKPEAMIFGTWTGTASEFKSKEHTAWHMSLAQQGSRGTLGHDITQFTVVSFDRKKKIMQVKAGYAIPGPIRRSARTGKRVAPAMKYLHLKGRLSDDWNTFTGQYVDGKTKGTFSFNKKVVQLPSELSGSYNADITIEHSSGPGADPYTLTVNFDNGGLQSSSWDAVHKCKMNLVHWLPKTREIAIFVEFTIKENSKKSVYGVLHGKFSESYSQLDAHFSCKSYGSTYAVLEKK